MRELEITPEPGEPAIAAAIARAIERLEREQGLTAPRRTSARRGPRRRAASSSTMASPDVLLGAGLYETVRVSDGVALHGERHLERMTGLGARARPPRAAARAFARAIAQATGSGEVVRVRLACAGRRGRAERASAARRWRRAGPRDRPRRLVRAGLPAARAQAHEPFPRRPGTPAGAGGRATTTRCSSTHDGRVGEATNANVAHVAGGVLVTPSVDGLLPGVCRAALLDAARELGLAVEARPVALAELIDADAVLLTSSPRGISELIELDGHVLRRMLRRICSRRCASAWRRRRGPTRWRYRDAREPGSGCGRPRARGRRPRARHRAGGGAARAGGPGQRAARVGRGPLVVPRAVAGRRALAARSGRRAGGGARAARPARRRRAGGRAAVHAAACSARSATTSRARSSRSRSSRATTSRCRRIQLAAVDSLYAFDRERDELWIVARAERELRRLREGLERVRPVARPAAPGDELRGMPYAHYRARVERVLDHIARGDVYEVNYTQRLEGNCSSALDLYARLRETAPVPYNLYLDAGGWQLVGATPETFLRVGADGRCETRPIKGTRPRADDPAADAALAAELATHPKDRAENVMIVDLARNDLSRVCEPGTVRVPALCAVESHPTVHQLVSTVDGSARARARRARPRSRRRSRRAR